MTFPKPMVEFDEHLSVERIKLLVELASYRLDGDYVELLHKGWTALGFSWHFKAGIQLHASSGYHPWFMDPEYKRVWIDVYNWALLRRDCVTLPGEPLTAEEWLVPTFVETLRETYVTAKEHGWQHVQDEIDNFKTLRHRDDESA